MDKETLSKVQPEKLRKKGMIIWNGIRYYLE